MSELGERTLTALARLHEQNPLKTTHGTANGIRGGAVSHISVTSAGVRPNASFTRSDTSRSSWSARRAFACSGTTVVTCSYGFAVMS